MNVLNIDYNRNENVFTVLVWLLICPEMVNGSLI